MRTLEEYLKSWASLSEWDNKTLEGVLGQPVCNNKSVGIQNKSVYYSKLIKMGISTIKDMLTESGNSMGFNKLKQKEVTTANYTFSGWELLTPSLVQCKLIFSIKTI